MEIAVFDGKEDTYWWILCTKKFFAVTGTPEAEKMTAVVPAMRGRALNWWRWWYSHHPQASWDSFTGAFLWRFKPKFRDVLPISDDEEEPNSESWNSVLTAPDEFLLPTDQIEVFPLKDDSVERLAMVETFVELLPPPKPEMQLAQQENEATKSQAEQQSNKTIAGEQKSTNPDLEPPPPQSSESDPFTGRNGFTRILAEIPLPKPPDRVSVSLPRRRRHPRTRLQWRRYPPHARPRRRRDWFRTLSHLHGGRAFHWVVDTCQLFDDTGWVANMTPACTPNKGLCIQSKYLADAQQNSHQTPQHHRTVTSTPFHYLAYPKKMDKRYSKSDYNYNSLHVIVAALANFGLGYSDFNCVIDSKKGNECTEQRSFIIRSLHHMESGHSLYDQTISSTGNTLSAFIEDNMIFCFGFGDGSWDMMKTFDDNAPSRHFDNFQFMNCIEIMKGSSHCHGYIGDGLHNTVVFVQGDLDDKPLEPVMLTDHGEIENGVPIDLVFANFLLHNSLEIDSKVKLPVSVQVEEIFPRIEELTCMFMSPVQQGYTLAIIIANGTISALLDCISSVVAVGLSNYIAIDCVDQLPKAGDLHVVPLFFSKEHARKIPGMEDYMPLLKVAAMENAAICASLIFRCAHFKQWDPGGVIFCHGKVSLNGRITWIDDNEFLEACYKHNLEDKVDLKGWGNDTVSTGEVSKALPHKGIGPLELIEAAQALHKGEEKPLSWLNDYILISRTRCIAVSITRIFPSHTIVHSICHCTLGNRCYILGTELCIKES